ncbi:SUKH-3 immunity protein [Micromonospora sediminicola]|uniref:SUKH-3 immunity protein n=1 Tax=Micromonospora sediminicola TaxID=946078 RepID=A0A1A9BI10_9ACTN|nr:MULTISPECIES: SUKH-3 domain-containing protein [Micromonospora]SBT68512.1 SUKH-3 immunity protein [Micromonospora sediminicola]
MRHGDEWDLPARAARELKAAGWSPRRRVDVTAWVSALAPEGFSAHDAARAFLTEFGGLTVRVSGPGRDYARVGVRLDPTLCLGQKAWFDSFDAATAGQLYPVGEEYDGHGSLAIDVAGNVHLLFNDQVKRLGTGGVGLARLLEGEDAPEEW